MVDNLASKHANQTPDHLARVARRATKGSHDKTVISFQFNYILSQSMDNPQPKVLQTDSIRGKHMLARQRKYRTENWTPTLKKVVELVDARRNAKVDGLLSKVDNQTTQH